MHEFAGDHRSWEPQLREFGKRYRCIAYAARSYKPSDVPADPAAYSFQHVMRDAVAVLDHLKIEQAHLIGLSMGGYTVLQVALNYPGACARLCLRARVGGLYTEITRVRSRHAVRAGGFRRKGRPTDGSEPYPVELKDRGFAEFSRQLAEHDAQGSAHMSRGLQGERPSLYDFEKEIRKLTTPALIVGGDEDERCVEPGLFLKDAIPASGLAIFPKTGHAVNLEEPDLFNQVVGDFLSARIVAAG